MGRRSRRVNLAPDLTPMIDMVFLLLIFFLVTSSFRKNELSLLLKLPKASQGGKGEQKKLKDLVIELSNEEIAVNGSKATMESLPETFKMTEPGILVNLRVDGEVRYQRLVTVLDLLREYKLENVSLITEKDKKE